MNTIILGGGIAGLSLAHFLKKPSTVLERQARLGGLCQSFDLNGIAYDIGPHIIFSKNKAVLDLHNSMIPTNRIRRSNQIFHKGRYVKYPFENDLGKLDAEDRDYCVQEFVSNPYESYEAKNMLQFFLKTFGEGITRIYLQPYNQKIWKFDAAYLDMQMVERIPKPPKEDVIKSAQGVETEGYTHQLYFNYPTSGGFQTLVDKYAEEVRKKSEIVNSVEIKKISKEGKNWKIESTQGVFQAENLINCIPVHELFKLIDAPSAVRATVDKLLYNSIHIVMLQVKADKIGDHFALYFADKDIIFHRLSKLNFLGSEYCLPEGGSTLMLEITFRPGSYLSTLSQEQILTRVKDDLVKLGFIKHEDVSATRVQTFPYAYVIYDLDHRKNTDYVLGYLQDQGIRSAGRFAEFEYLNSDQVVERTMKLANEINGENNV